MRSLLLASIFLSAALTAADPIDTAVIQENFQKMATEPGTVMFTPPADWKMADPSILPKYVKLLIVGTSSSEFPPSINLSYDPFQGTQKQYMKVIKEYNDSQGSAWKDLGTIRTEAGDAILLQVDTKTKWGLERQMQGILIKNGYAWIITCSALKDEFPTYYKVFFDAIKSMRVNPLLK